MKVWLILPAIVLGILIPIQPLLNAELRRAAGNDYLAAAINFSVGLAALIAIWIAMRAPLPTTASLGNAPWWAWTGGLIGAAFVVITLILAPKLGTVLTLGLILVSQMIASLVVDHYGWFRSEPRPANTARIVGVILVIAGVVLVQVGTQSAAEPVPAPDAEDAPAS